MRGVALVALAACGGASAVAPPANRTPPVAGVETIAQLDEPCELVVGNGELFVIAGPDLSHAIYRVAAAPGSTPVKLADAPGARSLVLDGAHLYWGDSGGVFVLPIAGGSPVNSLPLPDAVWSVAIRQSTLFAGMYQPGGGRSQVIMRTPSATSALPPLAGETPTVVADEGAIYVGTDKALTKLEHLVTPVELAHVEGGATAIVTAGHDVYFAAYVTIQHVSDLGGPVTQLAVAGGETYSIAVDGRYVYWSAFMPDDGGIYRVLRSGGAPERIARVGEATIAIAGGYLYWSDARQNAIRRMQR